jgi:hypothetical protein
MQEIQETQEVQETQNEISKQFVKVGNDILKSAKGYQEINPELLNIFEYTFKSYLDIVKYIQEGKNNINIIDLEKYVFSKIFNNMKFEKLNDNFNKNSKGNSKGNSKKSCNRNFGGNSKGNSNSSNSFNPNAVFDPNQNINDIDIVLLQSLKENINKTREPNKDKPSDKTSINEYVDKVKEKYKTKE